LTVALALAVAGCAQVVNDSQAQVPVKPPEQDGQKPDAEAPAAPKPLVAVSPDGTKIVYEVTGTGPALMLVHGGGQTRRSWNDMGYVDRLKDKFTVITLDRRGHGDSDKPPKAAAYALDNVLAVLLAVADAAKVQRFSVWGFGHGATVARYLAARSDRVAAAVLVSADMGAPVSGIVKDAIVGMRTRWQPLVEAQQAGTLDLTTLSPGDKAAWERGIGTASVALGALVEYPPLEPAEIKAPTLWVVGASDTDAMANAKAYEGKLAGTSVKLVTVSGLTYSDSFSKIDPVLEKVEPFLASIKTVS
jgi:pimeloyl-ACP methyl ester carboxylesterase